MAIIEYDARLRQKIDTLENWETHNPVLYDGEVAHVRKDAASADIIGHKVGDGTSTFKQLPWATANAADVHEWAKAETKPTYTPEEIDKLTTDQCYELSYIRKNPVKASDGSFTIPRFPMQRNVLDAICDPAYIMLYKDNTRKVKLTESDITITHKTAANTTYETDITMGTHGTIEINMMDSGNDIKVSPTDNEINGVYIQGKPVTYLSPKLLPNYLKQNMYYRDGSNEASGSLLTTDSYGSMQFAKNFTSLMQVAHHTNLT